MGSNLCKKENKNKKLENCLQLRLTKKPAKDKYKELENRYTRVIQKLF